MKMKIKPKEYAQILYEVTKDKKEKEIKPILENFVLLLSRNNDIKKADEIIKKYAEIYSQEEGMVEAELISARELPKNLQEAFKKYINELTGAKKAELKAEIDKSLIGGFILKYGSTIIDASLKNSLHKLKEEMKK